MPHQVATNNILTKRNTRGKLSPLKAADEKEKMVDISQLPQRKALLAKNAAEQAKNFQ